MNPLPRTIRFGPFELDVQTAELRKHGIKLRLHEQPFRILLMLLNQSGEVVSRESLRQALWPQDTVVEFEHSINAAIQRLRNALGDSAEYPRYVETLPRRGYRFIGEVDPQLIKLAEPLPSIAVLPFANLSADKENEYFSDGLAEEILNLLGRNPGLKVIARTSSFAFRGKDQDVTKMAEALRVRNILEGSVRKAGNRIRVTAQLINAADGYHLWSERYDRELADIFEVQDEIASAIAGALQVKLAPQPAPAERYKPNLPAYESYLKGQHHLHKTTPASLARADEYYQQAISLDAKFALPYRELAVSHVWQASVGLRPASEVMAQLQVWAQKALEIDPSLSDAHSCLATKAYAFDYDWDEAERRFSLALSRPPVPAITGQLYTLYTISLGRAAEAEAVMRRVVEADPLASFNRWCLAWILSETGRPHEAEQEIRQVLEFDERFYLGWYLLGRSQFVRGETVDALHSFEKAYALAPFYPHGVGALAAGFAQTGDEPHAQELLGKLGPREAYGVPLAWAAFYVYKGEPELAADWWEKLIDQRHPNAPLSPRTLGSGLLRSSRRWPALAKRMNLPESAW